LDLPPLPPCAPPASTPGPWLPSPTIGQCMRGTNQSEKESGRGGVPGPGARRPVRQWPRSAGPGTRGGQTLFTTSRAFSGPSGIYGIIAGGRTGQPNQSPPDLIYKVEHWARPDPLKAQLGKRAPPLIKTICPPQATPGVQALQSRQFLRTAVPTLMIAQESGIGKYLHGTFSRRCFIRFNSFEAKCHFFLSASRCRPG
jgi:hypothetical protein